MSDLKHFHEKAVLEAAIKRGPDKTTCPSEIARALFPMDWRKHMPAIRDAALALQKAGKVLITQGGKPVNLGQFKGPIRIKINVQHNASI